MIKFVAGVLVGAFSAKRPSEMRRIGHGLLLVFIFAWSVACAIAAVWIGVHA